MDSMMKKIELLSAKKVKSESIKHQESWIDEDHFKQFEPVAKVVTKSDNSTATLHHKCEM